MEVKTILLDGKEYVLVPVEIFNKSVGIEKPVDPSPPVPAPTLEDFEVAVTPTPAPPAQQESVVIVDAMPNVKKAQGKEYGYAKRLKEQNLQPEDVMVIRPGGFDTMPETPEIARNDYRSKTNPNLIKAKYGFYGEGVERDLG